MAGDPDGGVPAGIQLRRQPGGLPAACKDYFGLRSFGLNYGCLFAAFGLAGFSMPWVNGLIKDATGSSDLSYAIIIGLMMAAAVAGSGAPSLGPAPVADRC